MKIFSNIRLLYFAVLLLVCAISSPPPAIAQSNTTPFFSKYRAFCQLWNVSSEYYGTATQSNLGTQLDTIVNTGTVYLNTAQFNKYTPGVNTDTFTISPLWGAASLTLQASVLKCTGTPTVTVTPQMSNDGNTWANIPGQSAWSPNPTSLTAPLTNIWYLSATQAPYYRLAATGDNGSATTSIWATYYWLANFTFYQSGP